MKKLVLLFSIILFSASIFAQDTLLISKNYIPHTDTTLIFTPKNYNPDQKYPLVFMLHGWAGNYAQWSKTANLQHFADADSFVIVCPDGFYDCWYINSPKKPDSQFETFFFKDLVPEVFAKYNIDTTNIFITGLSMGGHGAMYLMLTHPKFFKSAGSTSGILDLTAFPEHWGLDKVLGPYKSNKKFWEEHSDINLLKNIKGTEKPIIVDCGTSDFSFQVNKNFAKLAKADDVNIKFITGPGNHSHKYWHKSIPAHFKFFHDLVVKDKRQNK